MATERPAARPGRSSFLLFSVAVFVAFFVAAMAFGVAAVMAAFVLFFPPILLVLAVGVRLVGWLRRKEPVETAERAETGAKPSHVAVSNTILFLAGVGFAGIFVVIVGGGLVQSEGVWNKVGGYAILAPFALLGLGGAVVVVGCIVSALFAPTLPLRVMARIGPRRELYAATLASMGGKLDEAWESASLYQDRYPADSRALYLKAQIRWRQQALEDAMDLADSAVELEPTAEAYLTRSTVWLFLGDYREVLADAVAALAANPKLTAAQVLRGAALIALRRLEAALECLRGQGGGAYRSLLGMQLGEAYRLLGDREAERAAYEGVLRWAPSERRRGLFADTMEAYALAQLGRREEAEAEAKRALARNEGDSMVLHARAVMAARASDSDAAFEALRGFLPQGASGLVEALMDPLFTPLLAEGRFRELLAWATGAQRQRLERVRAQRAARQPEQVG